LQGFLDRPPRATIFFLFRGNEPLQLVFQARAALPATVVPHQDPAAHRALLGAWWKEYTAPRTLLETRPDYPPLIENYLKSNLARRLNLPLPARDQTDPLKDMLKKELGLLLGDESLMLAMEQDRVLGLTNLGLPADQPLPEPINPPSLEAPEAAEKVAIEPIAMRVPAECFYVRFGNFGNFLWMQDTLATWGGDMQNLFQSRGLDYGMSQRIEKQLVMKTGPLARLLGSTVIADVALIGTDTFFREGAAYGMLFQARNSLGLVADIGGQRSERLKAGGVSEQKLKITGHDVSYLSSPDGSVRSYYASDGDYHFVTTSKALVERFFQAGGGADSLGAAKDFRHARTLMPLERNDTVWVYLSDAFFRNLTSPRYRLEMIRRLQAQSDIELVQLAVLDAACEGTPGGTIERLVAGAMLPPDFGPRPDGSVAVLEGGIVRDSLRGHRGSLVPVPDVQVTSATRAEVAEYQRFAAHYFENWGRMDPTIIGLKRIALEGNREQVFIDAQLSPFAAKHFEFFNNWAGPPDKVQVARIEGDIAHLDLSLKDQHIFAGLRDVGLPPALSPERLLPIGRLRDLAIGYLGTTGELGLLGFLDRPLLVRDPRDSRQIPLGMFRQQAGPFTVFSLQSDVLTTIMPQLHFDSEAPRLAQARLWIGDVAQARITPFVNNWGYNRTRETTLGNLRLMHALDEQLHVPPRDCKEAAEFVLEAKLISPLGGQYVYQESPGGTGYWTVAALDGGGPRTLLGPAAPQGYAAPPLNWFRGLQADAMMNEKTLSAHAEVLMQLPGKK
jgi:hypothetical protein